MTVPLRALRVSTSRQAENDLSIPDSAGRRRRITAPTALILARVFGNSPDFWLNVQRRTDIWDAMHSPRERERIKRACPIGAAA